MGRFSGLTGKICNSVETENDSVVSPLQDKKQKIVGSSLNSKILFMFS